MSATFHRYPGQNAEEFERFCQHVRDFRPRSILEVGSRQGRSLIRLCEAAMPALERVTVFDIPGGPWGASDSRPDLEACCDHLRSRGVTVDLHWLDSQSDETGVVAAGLAKHDLVFIDADHSLPAVRHDFERFLPVLSPEGWLVLHDINGSLAGHSQGQQMGVPIFWRELKASGQYECREIIERKAAYGIGLIRRKVKPQPA